jgi:hypothetical protein
MPSMPAVTLAWTSQPEPSQQWIPFLLEEVVREQRFVGRPEIAEPATIYVINTDKLPFAKIPKSFFESVRETPGVGLFNPNDEWYSGNYGRYRDFAFVLRFYHPAKFDNPGVLTLPLGYARSQPLRDGFKPASERRYVWAFMGKVFGSRIDMMRGLGPIEPQFTLAKVLADGTTLKQLSKTEYHDVLADSVFAPAPMGNVMLESYRVYEALENGAVPIVEKRRSRDYFRDLFGTHPLPAFGSWKAARAFVEEARRDPAGLDRLQAEVIGWWRQEKLELRRRVAAFVARGVRDELRAPLRTLPVAGRAWVRKLDQGVELLRHHSPAAARRRVAMSVERLVSTGTVVSAKRRSMTGRYEERERTWSGPRSEDDPTGRGA